MLENLELFVWSKDKVYHVSALRLCVCPGMLQEAPVRKVSIGYEQVVDMAECS